MRASPSGLTWVWTTKTPKKTTFHFDATDQGLAMVCVLFQGRRSKIKVMLPSGEKYDLQRFAEEVVRMNPTMSLAREALSRRK